MSACFYPPLASIPCDFASGYRRLPGFRPGDNPEVISSPVGLVPTNALVLTELAAFSVTGKPETDRLLSRILEESWSTRWIAGWHQKKEDANVPQRKPLFLPL
jgi:hypothetical protein